jgi:hypothetical protein
MLDGSRKAGVETLRGSHLVGSLERRARKQKLRRLLREAGHRPTAHDAQAPTRMLHQPSGRQIRSEARDGGSGTQPAFRAREDVSCRCVAGAVSAAVEQGVAAVDHLQPRGVAP